MLKKKTLTYFYMTFKFVLKLGGKILKHMFFFFNCNTSVKALEAVNYRFKTYRINFVK